MRAQRDFVHSLAKLSEALYTPGSSSSTTNVRPDARAAKARAEQLLADVSTPPLCYLPLCRSSDPLRPVLRIAPGEAAVFPTRARCSVMLCVEVRTRRPFSPSPSFLSRRGPRPDPPP